MKPGARPPVSYSADADGVGWIVFEETEGRANVISSAIQAALDTALTRAEDDPTLKALILCSANERVFLAGADLHELAALPDADAATAFSRRGQRLFQRITDFRVPVVAAIHGACVGGGFELALACHGRIASNADVTRIGLPETSLGLIPGWGGTARLPRLIGVPAALDHMLKARLLTAREALDAGMINHVVPGAELRAQAKDAACQLIPPARPMPLRAPTSVPAQFAEARRRVEVQTRGKQPALLAAIEVIEQSARAPFAEALEIEARKFGELAAGSVCKNLVRVFFLREAAKKRTLDGWFDEAASRTLDLPPIQRVGVVGAGVMGSGLAHWLAAQGVEVVMRDVQPEFLAAGFAVVRGLFDDAVRRGTCTAGEANAALHRIATTTHWHGFASCDLVIEAIVEDAAAKQALFTELAEVVGPDVILASNTSALPIEEIAGHVRNPERTLGLHFFNPVSRMQLVELILGKQTSAAAAGRALALVKTLGKSPVLCRSSPGFLVTRVLFFYLNAAVRLWEEGAPTGRIDQAMREFGWPMGPLRLIDEVGVDVTESIFGEMERSFPERFARSMACSRIVAAGLRGRKNSTSAGFYRYVGEGETCNDDVTVPLRVRAAPPEAATWREGVGDPHEIVNRLMSVMVDEAKRCLQEGVVKSSDDVDFAFLSGTGFPAFRGGLLHWADTR